MKIIHNSKYQFLFFILLFFIINFLQSNYTRLFEDEAYYWVWSKDLTWGYFDHPPLVALWVKISSFFFDNELGVRFFSIISFSIMLYFIWKLIDIKIKNNYVWLFFLLIVSIAFINIFGFVTTPDTPLMMFVAIFLFFYKKFLQNDSWLITLGLGFAMAGMLYSKYHGILVILFVLLSNLSLLKNKMFWVASIFGFLLYVPHLHWQFLNDYPTFRYHLFERGKKPYNFGKTLLHFVNLIAIIGFTFPLIYSAFYKEKIKDKFDKSLKWIVYGIIIFFSISSFKTEIQAQWNAVILIPLIVVTYPYFIKHKKARKWLVILGSINLFVILVGRIFLANSNLSPIALEPHLSQKWIPEVMSKTDKKPIVFVNSYRFASTYKFYTNIKTHSYSVIKGRKSQYDLNDFESNINHENVYAISHLIEGDPIFKRGKKIQNGISINDYSTFQKVKCLIDSETIEMVPHENKSLKFELENVYDKEISFENVHFIGVFQGDKNKIIKKVPLQIDNLTPLMPNQSRIMTATFKVPKIEADDDKITFRVGLQFYDLLEGFQGNKVTVKFEN